jgi:hypothetical protein
MSSQRTLLVALTGVALLVALLFLSQLGGRSLIARVFDGGGLLGGLGQAETELSGSGLREEDDIIIVIVAIINFFLPFAAVAAFVAFLVSGFMYILGFGSDTAIQRAKKIMIWSAVGLVVILFSFILTKFIITAATA